MSRCVRLAEDLVRAGRAALVEQHGARRVASALRARPTSAHTLIAVGKAAWAMAAGALEVGPMSGLVVCKEPPPVALPPSVDLRLAGHPRPDERSVAATHAALALAASVPADAELLVLISGGTSALLGGPIDGLSLEELVEVTDRLLRSGAPIEEINATRRRLGAALGGRLLQATRARVRALVLSDVLSGDLRTIGSGPLHPDAPSPADVARRDVEILAGPEALRDSARTALEAVGLRVSVRPALVDGDVTALVDELAEAAARLAPGEAFVAVGEPTLAVRGHGRGGRARHTALLLASHLGADRAALALASDGSDGTPDAAGAVVSSETVDDARRAAVDLAAAARDFDSGTALEALGAAIRTGPTGTNLTDLFVVARAA